ncbi:hypothetical protein FRC10_005850, partial [Ceratobasidium sp. 414]
CTGSPPAATSTLPCVGQDPDFPSGTSPVPQTQAHLVLSSSLANKSSAISTPG